MYKFKFADIGEGLHEGVVAEIHVKEGSSVNEGDSLFSVETDKVTSDIPAPATGTIAKILITEGQTVHVGDVIFHIDDGTGSELIEHDEVEAQTSATVQASVEVSSQPQQIQAKQFEVVNNTRNNGRVLATPLVRKMAADRNIDLSNVVGTGSGGKITVDDIASLGGSARVSTPKKVVVNKPAATPVQPKAADKSSTACGCSCEADKKPTPVKSTENDKRAKVAPIRNAIASAMKKSWGTVAYTNLVNEVNMTKLWDERKRIVNDVLEKTGVKLTFTAYTAIATIQALKEFPILNSKYDEATNELVQFEKINLGLAVDTPKGLMVPVIKDAGSKNIVEIAKEIVELATKARDGKITAAEMQGGTFTLTNYGSAGAFFGVPVINVGEIGILGTGAIVDRVYADGNGGFYNGKVMNLTTAADHRWVDGADIGRFVTRVKELLENPTEGVFNV